MASILIKQSEIEVSKGGLTSIESRPELLLADNITNYGDKVSLTMP